MSQRESGSRTAHLLSLFALLLGVIAGVAVWSTTTPPAAAETAEQREPPPPRPTGPAAVDQPQREAALLQGPADGPVAGRSPEQTFEQVVDRLCVLSGRTAALAQDDEIEAARELDAEAREVLERLLGDFADAGDRALAMVVAMPDAAEGARRLPGENIRLGVLQVVLAAELARRHDEATRLGERARIDELTRSVLDSMPIGANTAEMGDRVLHDRPYLQVTHEPMVLHLLQQASDGTFSREIATRMLLTLWDNLKATGARSSAELSQLALVLLDDSDPSQVVAACRQLLSDPHYRGLALAWLRERDDPTLAQAIAKLAGRELAPADALLVLRELSPQLQHTRGTFLAIGVRAPEVVADAYREHLAADTHPQLRRELVMGVGMLPDQRGLSIAKLALDNDPSVEVRIQAMFVHTVHGDAAGAEAAVNQVLDDPAVAGDPMHLAAVVLALQNLEHGDANTLARLGTRLQSMALAPRSRELLDEILARSVPGGGR
ncbi:MAG: hypothetical protein ACE37K_18745 [Planctomycetota bacterium]